MQLNSQWPDHKWMFNQDLNVRSSCIPSLQKQAWIIYWRSKTQATLTCLPNILQGSIHIYEHQGLIGSNWFSETQNLKAKHPWICSTSVVNVFKVFKYFFLFYLIKKCMTDVFSWSWFWANSMFELWQIFQHIMKEIVFIRNKGTDRNH